MKTIVFAIIVLQASVLNATWVSPIAHSPDSEEYWSRCWAVYDDDSTTYATEKSSGSTEWLTLEFATPLRIDAWRFLGKDDDENGGRNPVVRVEFYEGGVWKYGDVFTATKDVWYEEFGKLAYGVRVSKARISSYSANSYYLSVADFQLRYIPEPATILLLITGSLSLRLFRRF